MNAPDATLDQIARALAAGDLDDATRRIDELRAAMPANVSTAVRSRAARVAATAHRLRGDHDVAANLAIVAADLAMLDEDSDPMLAIEAEVETGDLAQARGDMAGAQGSYERALDLAKASSAPLTAVWTAQLRLAGLRAASGDTAGAVELLGHVAAGAPTAPGGAIDELPASYASLLTALDHVVAGRGTQALVALELAATAARRERDLTVYVSARIAASQVHEQLGDRPEAFRQLWVGWATVRTVTDEATARAAFEPIMEVYAQTWGLAAFREVRRSVDASLQGDTPND